MNFAKFPVSTTMIFPHVNSTAGGQLLSEYNLRSRESVATDSKVTYIIGPSYTHSLRDFAISGLGSTELEISAGMALVNGHFIDAQAPVFIDLAAYNINNASNPLTGALAVGLKANYVADGAVAGALNGEVIDGYFRGIEVVICPQDQFKLPSDEPNEMGNVTAHLKLADFSFINGVIGNIVQNDEKIHVISGDRIGRTDANLDKTYASIVGLNPQNFYTMAGDGRWCSSNESLMKWDVNSVPTSTTRPTRSEAAFVQDFGNQTVNFVVPHKQLDGLKNQDNVPLYIPDKVYPMPVADYDANTPGIINDAYTGKIKAAVKKLDDIHITTNGKQVWFLDTLSDEKDLPPIQNSWNIGDYVLVRQDTSVNTYAADLTQSPSTMYVILWGTVMTINTGSEDKPIGSQLGNIIKSTSETEPTAVDTITSQINIKAYNGVPNQDYFRCDWTHVVDNETVTTPIYFSVATASKTYSDPLYVTGSIPFAQEELIGGFLNVPESYTDGGYVIRDEYGHLRLIDYSLLRSGTLAYQLGQDFETPSGITTEEVQNLLDEYVNDRVAFPNAAQSENSSTPDIINVTITLPAEEAETTLVIGNIDSRFNTSVYLHILGEANSNTIINIVNCEKIRIDGKIAGSPTINLYRSNLYYDSFVLGYLKIVQDMNLWYERRSDDDADLTVEGLTVTYNGVPTNPDETSFSGGADVHVKTSLRSVTFDGTANIVGLSVFFRSNITEQEIDSSSPKTDRLYVSKFNISSTPGFQYPISRLTKQIKVTGIYTSMYIGNDGGYYLTELNVSALTPKYVEGISTDDGTMVIHSVGTYMGAGQEVETIEVSDVNTVLSPVQSDTYKVFEGYLYELTNA